MRLIIPTTTKNENNMIPQSSFDFRINVHLFSERMNQDQPNVHLKLQNGKKTVQRLTIIQNHLKLIASSRKETMSI